MLKTDIETLCRELATNMIPEKWQRYWRTKIYNKINERIGTNTTLDNFETLISPKILIYMLCTIISLK